MKNVIAKILLVAMFLIVIGDITVFSDNYYDKEAYEDALWNAAAYGYIRTDSGSADYGKTFNDPEVKYGFFTSLVLRAMYDEDIVASEEVQKQSYKLYNTSAALNVSDVAEYFKKVFNIDYDDIAINSNLFKENESLVAHHNSEYIIAYVNSIRYWGEVIVDSVRQVEGDVFYFKWHIYDHKENTQSEQLYAILGKEIVGGKDVVSYKYLSFDEPSGDILNVAGDSKNVSIKDNGISVTLNGNAIIFDQPPIIHNDRTLVPLRAIFEALGATVEWNGNTQTVTAVKDGTIIALTIGQYCFYKNGQQIDIDVPGMIVNNRTLVPVRAISESMGAEVIWDNDTRIVEIIYDSIKEDIDYSKYLGEHTNVYNEGTAHEASVTLTINKITDNMIDFECEFQPPRHIITMTADIGYFLDNLTAEAYGTYNIDFYHESPIKYEFKFKNDSIEFRYIFLDDNMSETEKEWDTFKIN